ncbi:PIG-L family deacetylase [Flavobacterium chuncheonense]|uniref:PIG-L family deacetylase n=1 Tax=Flavobacterium chuncheonense TaxID=2026653 RepID=A0ABW5YHY8_9FLAO
MLRKFIPFILLVLATVTVAQAPKKPNATEIYSQIQKLNFLGKVLYVAAHPDDENTKLISYFSNHYHAQTAYLSLTRGDGGQNLIGPELREKLGAIRTQELLAARNVDGGQQFFTRANDFGYSKEPNETFAIWNKEEVLADVIQTIETFQPDIIVNRFNHRTPGTTHGHHTASAMLSLEAYDLVKVKPSRVFFNTSWWFYGSHEKFDKADKSNLYAINANVYFPIIGKSNFEIAALSRSQHKCQGFGTTGTRGNETEYLEILKGKLPSSDNIFEGIDTSWNRVQGGAQIGAILNAVETNFNFKNPSIHIPQLIEAYQLIEQLKDEHWKTIKLEQLSRIIEACSGLYLEAVASTPYSTKNNTIDIAFETINRSNANVKLLNVSVLNNKTISKNTVLENNTNVTFEEKGFSIPSTIEYSNLFWLKERPTVGMYQVSNKAIRILPEEKLQFPVIFSLDINGKKIDFVKNLVYKINTPEEGETYTPFTLLPDATSEIVNKVSIFNANQTKEITVKVTTHRDNFKGNLELVTNPNWTIEPQNISFEITTKNDSKTFTFRVTSAKKEENSVVAAKITSDDSVFDQELIEIKYPHIPKQTILQPSEAKWVNLDIKTKGKNIGYIIGAGDEVGKYLENLNFNVSYLTPQDVTVEKVQAFDAIIIGIRAFNVLDELKFKNKILFNYVKNGGNLIVQYNTAHNLVTQEIAPFELSLSRDRITNENAKVTFLKSKSNILKSPNTITEQDFEGWVQERGLYFPNKWSSDFMPILAMQDDGEAPTNGALLIANYGKGHYVYTGLSFFRELPEGVSGAYKLLANLIALD